ncbi:MAG: zinc ribbon domain-containing protein [Thermodesulfobacteriota bacterium]
MPIFEFHCDKCGHDFEELVRSSHEKICCPECKGRKVRKQMSAVSFKSGGKYVSSSGPSCSSCGGGSCGTCH